MEATSRTPRQRTIIVGVDGSAGAARALRWAALEAAATDARLQVISSWELPNVAMPAMAGAYLQPEELAQGAARIAERAENDARRILGGRPVPIERLALHGSPAEVLLRASTEADLLVVGTRGRGGFASLVLGSVAQTCAHHARIPVVVVGHEYAEPGSGPIVVGMDESDQARDALDWAAAEAARLGTGLRVVHGWEICRSTPDGPPVFTADQDPAVADDVRRWYLDAAEVAVGRVGGGVPVEVEVVIAPPGAVEALVEASKTAALLVVGSRGRGGFAGLLLGSVSQQVLHHSACPVVVLPPGRPA